MLRCSLQGTTETKAGTRSPGLPFLITWVVVGRAEAGADTVGEGCLTECDHVHGERVGMYM